MGTPRSINGAMSNSAYGDPFVNEWSLQFNGVDDYIYVSDDDELDLIDELTISAWINPSESGNNIFRTFISKRDGNAGNYQLTLNNAAGANQGEFSFWNGSGTTVSSGYIPEMDDWTHVAVTISDGTNLSMYANGILLSLICPLSIFNHLLPKCFSFLHSFFPSLCIFKQPIYNPCNTHTFLTFIPTVIRF